ncbi:hypothetical protein B0H13DRAFT_1864713 [Mycena leptocephala]|nr:hypothetical protein B0H13DRAFT_1864713 [Mycena leptocephala]
MSSSKKPARTSRMRRRTARGGAPAGAASHSEVRVSTHTFSASDFLPAADRAIETFVDRPSDDSRRMYRDVIPIAPPSPIKKARVEAAKGGSTVDDQAQARFQQHNYDRYEMFTGDPADDPPLPPPPRPGRKGIFSDSTLYKWKARSVDRYLREFLRLDGPGDATEILCPGCKIAPDEEGYLAPAYRCRECFGGLLFCRKCVVERHMSNPLHLINAWTGERFVKTSLKALGMRVQFGHPPAERCDNPVAGHRDFVVLHHNGIHEVAVDFCGCENSQSAGAFDTQLLRGAWYPASEERPKTCITLVTLKKFHAETLQAKTTMYDFYRTLEHLTSNDGVKPPDRYQASQNAETGGKGHDPTGVRGTKPGELAVRCPACPRPGVNLPEGWENASKDDRFIYLLFLALDACFRMKRGLVSSELKDPGLGTGWAYMTEDGPYREYLRTVTDQKEMSTCSGLAALDYANTKFSRGYSTTGVGMAVCTRHEFIQPNGVGDLQRGERYANMDYVLASTLRHHDPRLPKIFSYDIVCQWWKKLMERLAELPELVRCILILPMIAFVIPKLHIHAHTILCHILYSLNLVPGSGQTDGEGIERPWANIGGIASSTRIMGPGARHDTVDDHWGNWNWQKLVGLGDTLRRRLNNALEQEVIQREAFESFSEQQGERAEEWKKMVHDYEEDSKKKNPYELVVEGLTEQQVRLEFQKEEEEDARKGIAGKHKVSPEAFMGECVDVEEEQHRVRVQAELKKAGSTAQQIDMGALRTKLIRRMDRLRKLQRTYSPSSILALELREAPENELPEDEPLFLPSALSEVERAAGCTEGLVDLEQRLRDAQCRTSLVRLRNQLHIKSRFLNYKKLHARHQGANTRSRTIVNRNESKIRLHSEKYQAARSALVTIAGGMSPRCMEDADDVKRKEERRKKAQAKRKRKYQELLDHGQEPNPWEDEEDEEDEDYGKEGNTRRGAGESTRGVSWIWLAAGLNGTDANLEEVYARSRRWNEEVRTLKEEFRRLPVSLEFEAEVWDQRLKDVPVGQIDVKEAQGMVAYASKQAALFRDLAARARNSETAAPVAKGKKHVRAAIVDPLAMGGRTALPWQEEDVDESEDEVFQDDDGDGEERGMVESDEELVMGGEVDDD